MSQDQYNVDDLLVLMARLRDPANGCPWDLAQDFRSIVPSTLEECYELAEAIEHDDFPHVREELGDVLFQVVFYSQLGQEQDLFSFEQVVHSLVAKLIRRHPHVFPEGHLHSRAGEPVVAAAVTESWELIKQREREARAQRSLLDDVPLALPALPRAQKLQKRASRVAFDWTDAVDVLDKVQEEVDELRVAMERQQAGEVADEFGDLLFSCVNLARHLQLDAESGLRHASQKFEARFRLMESLAEQRGLTFSELDEEQMDGLWEEVKKQSNRPA